MTGRSAGHERMTGPLVTFTRVAGTPGTSTLGTTTGDAGRPVTGASRGRGECSAGDDKPGDDKPEG
jgi:hypothetical protein